MPKTSGVPDRVLPESVDDGRGTKKGRECCCGLDYNVQGTPLNAALSYAPVYTGVKHP